jgi:WD40 repeat protein
VAGAEEPQRAENGVWRSAWRRSGRAAHMTRIGLVCLASLVVLSCNLPVSGSGSVKAAATAAPLGHQLPASAGYLYNLAWLRDGTLVVGTGLDTAPTSWPVWQLRPDGSELRQISLPPDRSCRLTSYMFPTALPDGRVGLTRTCHSLTDLSAAVDTIIAYDPKSQVFQTLADLMGRMHVSGTSWNPGMTRGVGAASSGICARVAWLTPNGPQGIPVEIGEGAKKWRLDDWLRRPPGQHCTNEGRADCPAWSPDGRQVALSASPESIGVDGQDRLDAVSGIYLIDVGSLHVSKVLDNLQNPCDLAWSPDGHWLAFTGKVRGQMGIWLFSPSTKALHLVAFNGEPSRPAWSPDGRRLAVIEDLSTTKWPPPTRLAVADVSSIIGRT